MPQSKAQSVNEQKIITDRSTMPFKQNNLMKDTWCKRGFYVGSGLGLFTAAKVHSNLASLHDIFWTLPRGYALSRSMAVGLVVALSCTGAGYAVDKIQAKLQR